jgi:hypothetical protein
MNWFRQDNMQTNKADIYTVSLHFAVDWIQMWTVIAERTVASKWLSWEKYSLTSDSLLVLPVYCSVSHTKFAQVLIGIVLKFRRGELRLVTSVFWIYMWIEGSYPFVPKHNNNCNEPLEVTAQIQSGPNGLSRYATKKCVVSSATSRRKNSHEN